MGLVLSNDTMELVWVFWVQSVSTEFKRTQVVADEK